MSEVKSMMHLACLRGERYALRGMVALFFVNGAVGLLIGYADAWQRTPVSYAMAGQFLGVLILLMFVPAYLFRLYGYSAFVQMSAAALCACMGGWLGRYALWRYADISIFPQLAFDSPAVPIFGLSLVGFATLYYDARARLFRHQKLAEEAERASVEAELRALQAQVEPRFLFDTLSHIDGLILQRRDDAKALLTQLNRYLRASLAQARGDCASLDTEFALLAAYVAIISVCEKRDLGICFEGEAQSKNVRFPPLLIQPLLQLVLSQSFNSSVQIDIKTRLEKERLVLLLTDSDGGLLRMHQANHETFVEVRKRLDALFGVNASLGMSEELPGLALCIPIPCAHGEA